MSDKIVKNKCKLCSNLSTLMESHVIPKFVYKWIKETSATGYMRFGMQPNKRVQDGYKYYWLCEKCEEKFNDWETIFSKTVFHPVNQGYNDIIRYSNWLLPFCVSISWRVLNLFIQNQQLNHLTLDQQNEAKLAEDTWRQFLLGNIPHPAKYEQHFLPLDLIEKYDFSDMPVNINRYILRSVDIDLANNDTSAFIYTKLGRFVVIGFIQQPNKEDWSDTKIHVRNGYTKKRGYTLPILFSNYLKMRAERMDQVYNKISANQKLIIDETLTNDMDRLSKSETFRALENDVMLFGKDAFKKEN